VAYRLIRRSGGINVHVVPAQPETAIETRSTVQATTALAAGNVWDYAGSIGFVAIALLVALVLRQTLAVSSTALTFLIAVLASAVTYGLWPSLFACLASVLAYNFFFLPPLYTFSIADPENVVTLFFFAVVALIASNLAARVRAQAIAARQRARMTEELYLFSRKLASAPALDDLLWATVHQIALMLKVRVVILLPEADHLVVRAGFPPEDALDEADLAAAVWCWANNQAAGRGADTLPGAKRLFMPMRTGRGAVGVVGIDREEAGTLLSPEQHRLLNALSDQAALAIERVNLVQDVDRARLVAETDRLRSALLTSISHDLRTPLASILGSASSLADYGPDLDAATHHALLLTIREEAERLNRFIGNLLDMTRLESGPLTLRGETADLSDAVGAVLNRAGKILAGHRIEIAVARGLPMLQLDLVLFEQVLFNLLDNAAKYAPPGSLIQLRAEQEAQCVVLQVLDEGEGLPEADLEHIFDKFFRVHRADHQRAGTGLGLAICRGFVEAMDGTISASNRLDRSGAVFTIRLPVTAVSEPPIEVSA
jgi:two-component system sensor histidine kinase KdpD